MRNTSTTNGARKVGEMLQANEVIKDGPWAGFDVVHAYSRAQALEDGVLVNVSETAREAGIKFPVALTRTVWVKLVEVPKGTEGLQDESGRLWDVLWMMSRAIRASSGGRRIDYAVIAVTGVSKRGRIKRETLKLKAMCGPGDDAAPVITVMFPDED